MALHLVQSLRIHGAVPPFPHMPLRHAEIILPFLFFSFTCTFINFCMLSPVVFCAFIADGEDEKIQGEGLDRWHTWHGKNGIHG